MLWGKKPKCPRCHDGGGKLGRATPQVPWSFQEHPVDTQELIMLGAQQPLGRRPSFAFGVRVQEVFAGSARWTRAMEEEGFAANTPIELYEDPLNRRGCREHFNLKNPAVVEKLKEEAYAMPGPDSANIWEFGTPCTSYCDFNRINGGTRSYECPTGENPTETEKDGNYFCELTCDLCEALFHNDKEFVLESSMPSGKYPKIWDQPWVRRLQEVTGALIVPTHLCEWGASPVDQPQLRYKKGQWNLVSPGLYLYALLLARRCQGQHRHLEVKGPSSVPGVPRTREAQVYPARLCKAWALVVKAAYEGWGWQQVAKMLTDNGDGRKAGFAERAGEELQEGANQSGGPPPIFVDEVDPSEELKIIFYENRIGKTSSRTSTTLPFTAATPSEATGSTTPTASSAATWSSTPTSCTMASFRTTRTPGASRIPRCTGRSQCTFAEVEEEEHRCGSGGPIEGPPLPPTLPDQQVEEEEEEEVLLEDLIVGFDPVEGVWAEPDEERNQQEHEDESEDERPLPPLPAEGGPPNFFGWRAHRPESEEENEGDDSGDVWELMEVAGCLVRHHRVPRTTLFGHNEGDWEDCPIDPVRLRSERRSWQGFPSERCNSRALLDNWKEQFQLREARGVDYVERHFEEWTGRTTFFIVIEEHDSRVGWVEEHHREGDQPPDDDEGPDEPEEGPDRGQLDATTTRRRSRSRHREDADGSENRDGGQRRCLGVEDYNDPNFYKPEVLKLAQDYIEHCVNHPKYKPEVVKEAAIKGDRLLKESGNLETAMGALRVARKQIVGEATKGAVDDAVQQCLTSEHAEYLKSPT